VTRGRPPRDARASPGPTASSTEPRPSRSAPRAPGTCGPEVAAGVDLDFGRLAAVLGEVEVHRRPQRGTAQQQQEAPQCLHSRPGGTRSRLAAPPGPLQFISSGGAGALQAAPLLEPPPPAPSRPPRPLSASLGFTGRPGCGGTAGAIKSPSPSAAALRFCLHYHPKRTPKMTTVQPETAPKQPPKDPNVVQTARRQTISSWPKWHQNDSGTIPRWH